MYLFIVTTFKPRDSFVVCWLMRWWRWVTGEFCRSQVLGEDQSILCIHWEVQYKDKLIYLCDVYDISQFLHYNFRAFLKLTLLLCKTTEYFNEKKSITWNSRMHIDMHVISVKFSFQFANTIISRIETTHTEDTFRSFPSSNFRTNLFKLCLTTLFRIILLKSPKRILQYLYELPL